MFKFVFVLTVAFAIGLCMFGCGDDAIVSEPNSALCTGHPEWWPVMFKEGSSINGVGSDIASTCLQDIGYQMNSSYQGSWDQVLEKAKNGQIDLVVGAYKTAEREEYMVYSDKYMTDPVVLITSTASNIAYGGSWDELKTMKIVATVGDSYGQTLDQFLIDNNVNITRVDNVIDAFNMLESGQADGFIYSYYSARKHLSDSGETDKFKIQMPYLTEQNFYICLSKKGKLANRIADINASIAKNKENGVIDGLIKKYLDTLK